MEVVQAQPFVLLALSGIGAVLFWGARVVLSRISALKDELAAHRLHVAETYVPNSTMQKAIDTFNKAIEAVFAKLDRIDDKLDKKADRAQ